MKIRKYFQIDYIDKNGTATYIDTIPFEDCTNLDSIKRALARVADLQTVNAAINGNTTRFVLDLYCCIEDENGVIDNTDEVVFQDLQNIDMSKLI